MNISKKPEKYMSKQEHSWQVSREDTVGITIETPKDYVDVVWEILSPVVSRSILVTPDNLPWFFITSGYGTYKGRNIPHKFVSVICDPPHWATADPALGMLAIIGAQRDYGANFFWKYGYQRVVGRVSLNVDMDGRSARGRIATARKTLEVIAQFDAQGEEWSTLPNHLYDMNPDNPVLRTGDEWAVRHDGTGIITVEDEKGNKTRFETYVGLYDQLGWDYQF
jgi:hypothetical protein